MQSVRLVGLYKERIGLCVASAGVTKILKGEEMKEYNEMTLQEKAELTKCITQDKDFDDIMRYSVLLTLSEMIVNKK